MLQNRRKTPLYQRRFSHAQATSTFKPDPRLAVGQTARLPLLDSHQPPGAEFDQGRSCTTARYRSLLLVLSGSGPFQPPFSGVHLDEDRGAAAFTLTQNYDQVAINDDQNPCVEAFGPALVNGVDGLGRDLVGDYTLALNGQVNAITGATRFDLILRAKVSVAGESFKLTMTDHFSSHGGGTLQFNCHDGSGPHRIQY